MRVLVLHGPNLNRLGVREPQVYGTDTLAQIDERIRQAAAALGVHTEHRQSNHEGVLIDLLHAAEGAFDAVVFNPGAYTHYAWALRDAVTSIRLPVVEVHLSEPRQREPWRHVSVLDGVAAHRIAGRGWTGYVDALRWLVDASNPR